MINKLDRDRASFERTMESIHARFGRAAVPIQLPLGSEKDFRGVIDLIRMKAYLYTPDGDGKSREAEIPAEYAEAAKLAHEELVELVAEGKDDLMEEFFEKGTLPEEHIVAGLDEEMREWRVFPIVCMSGPHNIGSDMLLNLIAEAFPSPLDRPPVKLTLNGAAIERKYSDSEPAAAYVFKTTADPFAGRITYFKVLSGCVKNDANLQNVTHSTTERLAHIGVPLGKTIVPVNELHAGDIGAVAKLRETLTGDTLTDKSSPVVFAPVKLAEPSIAFAVEAKSRNDEDRMGNALHKLLEEDLSLRFYRDPQTKEFLIAGTGQQHVEIAVSRLKKRYAVDVTLKAPKIPYRETIRGTADVQGRHKKQTGGHGQFGDCWIRMEPLPRGAKFEFVNDIFGGSIPKNYIPAVEKGIIETAERGFLAGFPMVDFRVTVYDGSYHDVDSSELAFKLAARKAFRNAMQTAKPTLLEPVMNVEVQAPVEYRGRSDGRSQRPPRTHRRHGYARRNPDHPGAGSDGGNAELSERPDVDNSRQGFIFHGVRPLRLRAAATGRQDHCGRQSGANGRRRTGRRIEKLSMCRQSSRCAGHVSGRCVDIDTPVDAVVTRGVGLKESLYGPSARETS